MTEIETGGANLAEEQFVAAPVALTIEDVGARQRW